MTSMITFTPFSLDGKYAEIASRIEHFFGAKSVTIRLTKLQERLS